MAKSNIIEIIISAKDLTKAALSGVKNNLDAIGKASQSVADSVFNLKNSLLSLGVGVALKDIISTFANFDDVMRAVGAISGATAEEFEQLTETAKRMGAETRFTASQAAEGLKLLAMAGFNAQQQLATLPGTLQLAAAGQMDLGRAADIVTNVLTAYGMKAEELGRVNDVMVKAFTSSNSTLVELGEGFKYVGPIAKGMGTDFEDLVGSLAALHNAGIKGSMSGTTLRGVLDSLFNPTREEAALMQELSARIGGAGLQIKDTEGKFVGFVSILKQLENAGLQSDEALKLFGLRAGPGMAALLQQGSKVVGELTEKLENSGGTAARIANQMEAGLGGTLRLLASKWEGLKIAFGEGIDETSMGFFQFLIDKILILTKAIEDLIKEGIFAEWSTRISQSLMGVVSVFEEFGKILIYVTTLLRPVIVRFTELLPSIIAVGLAALTLSKSISLVTGSLSTLTTIMGGNALLSFVKNVQVATVQMGLFETATASAKLGLTVMGSALAAAFVGWQIGKFIGELKLFENGTRTVNEQIQIWMQKLEGVTQAFIKLSPFAGLIAKILGVEKGTQNLQQMADAIQPILNNLEKFKNFKLPDDFADLSKNALTEVNKELEKSKLYWDAYIRQQEFVAQAAKEAGLEQSSAYRKAQDNIQAAKEKLDELTEAAGKLKNIEGIKFDKMTADLKDYSDGMRAALNTTTGLLETEKNKRLAIAKVLFESEIYEAQRTGQQTTEILKKYEDIKYKINSEYSDKEIAARQEAWQEIEASYGKNSEAHKALIEKITADSIAEVEKRKEAEIKSIQAKGPELQLSQATIEGLTQRVIQDSENEKNRIRQEASKKALAIIQDFAITEKNILGLRVEDLVKKYDTENKLRESAHQQQIALLQNQGQSELAQIESINSQKMALEQDYFNGNASAWSEYSSQLSTIYQEDFNKKKTIKEQEVAENEKYYTLQVKQASDTIAQIENLFSAELKNKIATNQALSEEEKKAVEAYQTAIKAKIGFETELNKTKLQLQTESLVSEKEANELRIQAAQEAFDEYKNLLQSEAGIRQAELSIVLADIGALEQQGVLTHQEAIEQKKLSELEFAEYRLAQAEAVLSALEDLNQTETIKYQEATAAKMQAQAELTTAETEFAEVTKEVTEAIEESADAAIEADEELHMSITRTTDQMRELREVSQVPVFLDVDVMRAQENLFELEGAINDAFQNMNAAQGRFESIVQVNSELWYSLSKTKEEFDALSIKAKEAGLSIDLSSYSLSQATEEVNNRISTWQGFQVEIDNIKTKFSELSLGLSDFADAGITEAQTAFDNTSASISDFETRINDVYEALQTGNFDAASQMAEDVRASYEEIFDVAKSKLDDLKSEWQDYYDQVAAINEQIEQINMDADARVRELMRSTMSELELFNDRRLEYEEIYARALNELNIGNAEAAAELFEQAMDVAESLAVEVRDTSGNVLTSLEENTSTAIQLITEAQNEATRALERYQGSLQSSQQQTQSAINDTIIRMSEFSRLMDNNAQRDMNVSFFGTASPRRPLTETLANLGLEFSNFANSIIPEKLSNMDFSGLTTGLDTSAAKVNSSLGQLGNLGGVKDLGKITLETNGKAYPVMGSPDVLTQLKDALRWEGMITA